MNKTYVAITACESGERKRRVVRTPVLWCQGCRRMGTTQPVGGQDEARREDFVWSCAHCKGIMRRLTIRHAAGTDVVIPLSYCLPCASVSFRAILDRNAEGECDMCHAAVPATRRWCGPCGMVVKKWRRLHGAVPPPGDGRLEGVLRNVVREALARGWSWNPDRRICRLCRKEYAPSSRQQRRCGGCIELGTRKGKGRVMAAAEAVAA